MQNTTVVSQRTQFPRHTGECVPVVHPGVDNISSLRKLTIQE